MELNFYNWFNFLFDFHYIMSKLHIDSIQKSYDNKPVLNDTFISCKTGEIIGLLGRNGSGKTTLMQIVFGSLQAENKYINVDGKILHNLFDNRNIIHFLPQFDFLPQHIKIKTIISLFCDKESTKKLIENPIFKPLLNLKINQLSGGEKRIVSVYALLYSNAEFILLDEPFNGIAPIQREEIQKIILEQSPNKGIIISDHDYRSVLEIATKIILLHDDGTKIINDQNELIEWGYLSGI
jgi:ABC-type multidrug transport system ATPase subunit